MKKYFGKQMTTVHILHPKFHQTSYVWKKLALDSDASYNFYATWEFKSFEKV